MVPTRRRFLAGAAAATASVSVAGCFGGEESVTFDEHAASEGVDDQPTLGSLDRPGVVVAFEDPSCLSCRRFEDETLPRLREELIAPGEVAFVYRTLDITYPWAEVAAQLLASTYAADEATFWELKAFYYDQQDSFEVGNVFERTDPFLQESTVDAESVLRNARQKLHDGWIASNRNAASELDVRATPRFYLFRDGQFRTEVSGPQDYDVFAGALGFE